MGGDPRQVCSLVRRAALLLGTGAVLPAHAATIQDFDAPGTAYTLTQYQNAPGAAVLPSGPTGNFLRLAWGGSSVTLNTIGFDRTDPGAHPEIVAAFDFRMQRYGTGADGFGFLLLDTSVYGTEGASPLFREYVELPDSLGVGFNIFENWETNDPNSNFLRLTYGGVLVAEVADPGVDLASGQWIHARFQVAATPGGGALTLELTPAGGVPVYPLLDVLIPGYAPFEARVALAGRTGAHSADHDIDNVMVSFVPEPSSAVLLALGLAALAIRRRARDPNLTARAALVQTGPARRGLEVPMACFPLLVALLLVVGGGPAAADLIPFSLTEAAFFTVTATDESNGTPLVATVQSFPLTFSGSIDTAEVDAVGVSTSSQTLFTFATAVDLGAFNLTVDPPGFTPPFQRTATLSYALAGQVAIAHTPYAAISIDPFTLESEHFRPIAFTFQNMVFTLTVDGTPQMFAVREGVTLPPDVQMLFTDVPEPALLGLDLDTGRIGAHLLQNFELPSFLQGGLGGAVTGAPNVNFRVLAAVPEPSSAALLGLGLTLLGLRRGRARCSKRSYWRPYSACVLAIVALLAPLAALAQPDPRPVTLTNFPDPQNVAGTVEVTNLPAVQDVNVVGGASGDCPAPFRFEGEE